jgi:hypothetical protein
MWPFLRRRTALSFIVAMACNCKIGDSEGSLPLVVVGATPSGCRCCSGNTSWKYLVLSHCAEAMIDNNNTLPLGVELTLRDANVWKRFVRQQKGWIVGRIDGFHPASTVEWNLWSHTGAIKSDWHLSSGWPMPESNISMSMRPNSFNMRQIISALASFDDLTNIGISREWPQCC